MAHKIKNLGEGRYAVIVDGESIGYVEKYEETKTAPRRGYWQVPCTRWQVFYHPENKRLYFNSKPQFYMEADPRTRRDAVGKLLAHHAARTNNNQE